MFRKTLLASAMLAALASPTFANYQDGNTAYEQGRYGAAYLEYKASADAGHAAAQYMLGRLYQEGRGTDYSLVQAYAWYDLSAFNGYSKAAAARDAVAVQLSSSQLAQASNLAYQFRGQVSTPDSPTPVATSYPAYSARNLQLALNQLGYNVGTADGAIGPKSKAAIKAYQIDSGLPVSSEPSLALYEHMQKTIAERGGTATAPTTPTASITLVSEIQAELRLRDYAIPSINGQLDAATIAAIKRYQADAALTVDGKASDTLLAQLRSGRTDPAMDYRAQVKAVQSALNSKGYDAGPADGALGPKTRTAIRNYQAASGLSVTGEIGPTLLDSLAIASNGTTPTTPTGASATLIASIEGELIKRNYAAGVIDGTLDGQARNAISLFQKDAGLEVTGQASQGLLDKLRVSGLQNQSETVSQLIYSVEGQLKAKGYSYGPIDGTMDEDTREGIEDFQQDAGLKVTGKANNKLLASLETAVVVGGNDGGGGTNSNSLTGRQIWEVEARLNARGYDVGAVDTSADAKTYAAVRTYQKDQGLAVNGNLDQSLLTRLQKADAGEQQGSAPLTKEEKGMLIVKGILDTFIK